MCGDGCHCIDWSVGVGWVGEEWVFGGTGANGNVYAFCGLGIGYVVWHGLCYEFPTLRDVTMYVHGHRIIMVRTPRYVTMYVHGLRFRKFFNAKARDHAHTWSQIYGDTSAKT